MNPRTLFADAEAAQHLQRLLSPTPIVRGLTKTRFLEIWRFMKTTLDLPDGRKCAK